MKNKTVLILICILISSSVSVASQPIFLSQKNKEYLTFNDDVPIWTEGESWTYIINDFVVNRSDSSSEIFIDGKIDDLKWTVVDTSGSNYKVDFKGKLNAEYNIYLSSSITLDVSGTFKPSLTNLVGSIYFTKSNLEISDVTLKITGITLAKITPIPVPLPIPFKLIFDVDLNKNFPLFDFPLEPKFWNLYLFEVKTSVNVGGIFGFIQTSVNFESDYLWIPFECEEKQDVTVPAGTFSAYRILPALGNFFEYYYAPSVENLIKINVDIYTAKVIGELKSTNKP